ncbi:hypothetical protein [Halodurantibacterium flavum]|uniref:Phage tail assembly chaperone n=1 Tax=Halodurantibacterium flavum TaxID=1382802 RepID=A0ABW4S9G5_9RHOB
MLKISKNPEFTHKVRVRVPVDGGYSDQEFKARFRVLPWDEVEKLDRNPTEQLRQIWIGWEDIADDQGVPVPYSDAVRDQLAALLYVRVALLSAYSDAISGARRGN